MAEVHDREKLLTSYGRQEASAGGDRDKKPLEDMPPVTYFLQPCSHCILLHHFPVVHSAINRLTH